LGDLLRGDGFLVAYLFGSYARGIQTINSDIDIAILLRDIPEEMLDYYLDLISELSKILTREVDLIILNTAPPLLKYQVIRHGRLIHCKDEEARIKFEARTQDEYLDFSRAMERYDECFLKKILV